MFGCGNIDSIQDFHFEHTVCRSSGGGYKLRKPFTITRERCLLLQPRAGQLCTMVSGPEAFARVVSDRTSDQVFQSRE